jgi:tetratricopeptide (TPR) repeat protein
MKFRLPHIVILLMIVFGMSGCKSIFKSRWSNFNAFYNTFYNAEQYYKRGYNKVMLRVDPINPEQPIRIHKRPNTTVDSDFENAILKGADILRDFPDSKWVDDALLLIGKSYYFQGQFYSADMKFQELLSATNSISMMQQGVIWRGRFFLESEQYERGIDYLNSMLFDEELRWRGAEEAEVLLLIAQLHVELEDWQLAEEKLVAGLESARGRQTLANGWFLLGQVRERLDDEVGSIAAFSRVPRFNPDYSMVYNARRKQAEISRETGRLNEALKLFIDMSRDDKNFDELAELNYEIGRTYQLLEDYPRAERFYFDVLRYNIKTPTVETKAKTYYGLAEINKDYYTDYFRAAAYYDSAATSGKDLDKLPSWFDAAELSLSYNNYRRLSIEAHEADSLLWLSNLNEEAFDSVIAIVRLQKFAQMREEMRRQQAAANTMINLGAGSQNLGGSSGASLSSGFLNHKNQTMVNDAKAAFRAIWGDRQLVDNWRRLDAVRLAREDPELAGDQLGGAGSGTSDEMSVEIDFSKIPFSPEEKEKSRESIANKIYEIGNVFFLQLNMPDSADYRYRRVISLYPDLPVAAQAKYSLSELYFTQGDSTASQIWADRLVADHPETIYRNRLAERFPTRILPIDMGLTSEDSIRVEFDQRLEAIRDSLSVEVIEKLRDYSSEKFDSPQAPDAMLLVAHKYIELGKEDNVYKENYPRYTELNLEWSRKESIFAALKDSAIVILADSMATAADSLEWKPIADSVFKKPTFPQYYPYYGAMWDSSRVVLSQWETQFPTSPKRDVVSRLSASLKYPTYVTAYLDSIRIANEPKPEVLTDSLGKPLLSVDMDSTMSDSLRAVMEANVAAMQSAVDSSAAAQVPPQVMDTTQNVIQFPPPVESPPAEEQKSMIMPDGRKVYTTEEVGVKFEPIIEMDRFIDDLKLEDAFQGVTISGELKYRIRINEFGQPIEVDVIDAAGLDAVATYISHAIREALAFKPINGPDGEPVVVEGDLIIKL